MVNVHCHTNIDCAKRLGWPTQLPERPIEGDLIRSTSSTNRTHIELRVVNCTWYLDTPTNVWKLDVELHLPTSRFETIEAFEKFINRGY